MKKAIETTKAPSAIGPYSQGIVIGEWVFCSGQIGVDATTGIMPDSIEEQTKKVLENICSILEEQYMTLENIVKTTIFLTDLGDFQEVNSVYEAYFSKPYPARSTVEISALPKGAYVEIECMAFNPHI